MKKLIFFFLFLVSGFASKAQPYITIYNPITNQCGLAWYGLCNGVPSDIWVEDSLHFELYDVNMYYSLNYLHTPAKATYFVGVDDSGRVFRAKSPVTPYSGTTNASGVYTVTFPTAYSSTPNIQANIVNQSSNNQILKVTSISTTGFSVQAVERSTTTILGIIVLRETVTNVNGAQIHALISEQ